MSFSKKMIFALGILLMVQQYAFPLIGFNQVSRAYSENPLTQSYTHDSMNNLISQTSGYFFVGQSKVQTLLVIYELQDIKGFNSAEFEPILHDALLQFQHAREMCQRLVKKAKSTPYDKKILLALKHFPYEELQHNEGLLKTTLGQVEKFLKNGNITGIFKLKVQQYTNMISILQQIKAEFNAGHVPEVGLLWQLNETVAGNTLLDSYVARVFAQIK